MDPSNAQGVIPYSPDPYHIPAGYTLTTAQFNANAVDLLIRNNAYSNIALVPPAVVWPGETPVVDLTAWEKWRAPVSRLDVVDTNGVVLDVAGRVLVLTDNPTQIPPGIVATLNYSVGYAVLENFTTDALVATETFFLSLGAGTYKIVPILCEDNPGAVLVQVTQGANTFEGYGPFQLEDGSITVTFTAAAAGQSGGVLCKTA